MTVDFGLSLATMSDHQEKQTPEYSTDPFKGFPHPKSMPAPAYLENLCRILIAYLNTHTIQDFGPVAKKYLSPDFKYESQGPNAFLNSTNRDEYYNHLVALTASAPGIQVEPTDVLVDVDEERGKATLRSTSRIKAVFETSEAIVREGVEITRWRREEGGDWVCSGLTLMTGPGGAMFE